MKNEKKVIPASKEKKTGPGSNPVNKFKKDQHTTEAEVKKITKDAVEKVKPHARKGIPDIDI